MKSISWITSSYFLQVDLPILYKLKDSFEIKWIVYASNDDKIETACNYAEKHGISLQIERVKAHAYSPVSYFEYSAQLRRLALCKSDIYYFNIVAFPYMIIAIKKHLRDNKVIMAMHHGEIHNGMRLRHLYKYYLRYLCKQPFYFQYYSNTQAACFTGDQMRKFVIPLALNDYGKAEDPTTEECVTFLSFGHIISTKNIELLIDAACKLKELCSKPFKVKIVGHCRFWDLKYQPLIKYPDIFDLTIKSIPDSDIPALFSSAHYLILPYKSVTQSGPLRIAYGYNLPVVVSDLEGFKESVVDGITGLFFKSENVNDLVITLKRLVDTHPESYLNLKKMQSQYVEKSLSTNTIVERYNNMFSTIGML